MPNFDSISPFSRTEDASTANLDSLAKATQVKPRIVPALFVKITFDKVLACLGLVALAPLLLACAGIIRLVSPGPAIFSQMRVGYAGREFKIFKLRTMHHAVGLADSDRVFRFGGLLRRLSIDELPQLVNVLRGEMSLVGPRPHMAGQMVDGVAFADAVFQYHRRHHVMPGMTGWAQVNGCRGPAVTRGQIARRVAHDLYYVEHWSLKLDFLILLKTVCFGFMDENEV
jgi:lipopolysaccharide/colanic/teichoic acid biosynthesis glycosyltransferase